LGTATSVTVEVVLPAVAPTAGLQPSIPPFSESNRNRAGAECPAASWMTNPVGSVLKTCDVAPLMNCHPEEGVSPT